MLLVAVFVAVLYRVKQIWMFANGSSQTRYMHVLIYTIACHTLVLSVLVS